MQSVWILLIGLVASARVANTKWVAYMDIGTSGARMKFYEGTEDGRIINRANPGSGVSDKFHFLTNEGKGGFDDDLVKESSETAVRKTAEFLKTTDQKEIAFHSMSTYAMRVHPEGQKIMETATKYLAEAASKTEGINFEYVVKSIGKEEGFVGFTSARVAFYSPNHPFEKFGFEFSAAEMGKGSYQLTFRSDKPVSDEEGFTIGGNGFFSKSFAYGYGSLGSAIAKSQIPQLQVCSQQSFDFDRCKKHMDGMFDIDLGEHTPPQAVVGVGGLVPKLKSNFRQLNDLEEEFISFGYLVNAVRNCLNAGFDSEENLLPQEKYMETVWMMTAIIKVLENSGFTEKTQVMLVKKIGGTMLGGGPGLLYLAAKDGVRDVVGSDQILHEPKKSNALFTQFGEEGHEENNPLSRAVSLILEKIRNDMRLFG